MKLNNCDAFFPFNTYLFPLPIKVILGPFFGGKVGKAYMNSLMSKSSEYRHLKITHKAEGSTRVTL